MRSLEAPTLGLTFDLLGRGALSIGVTITQVHTQSDKDHKFTAHRHR
jgi:hypothetical protein